MQRLSLRVIFCRCCCCSVFFASFSSEALFSLSLLYSDIRITTTMHLDRWKNRFLIRCVGKKTYKKEVDIVRLCCMRCFLICGLKRSIITIFDMRKEESKELEMNESTTSLRRRLNQRVLASLPVVSILVQPTEMVCFCFTMNKHS